MTQAFDRYATQLLDLLTEQRSQHRRLQLLTERQRILVADDDPQNLLALLAERQGVVDGLGALNQRLAPYRETWTRTYHELDPATRRQVKELLEESNELLAAVLNSDRADTETLGARREVAASTLSSSRLTGRATAAYTAAGAAAAPPVLAESHA